MCIINVENCYFFLRLDWGCLGMPDKNLYAKPFLRWAGGKTWLTKHLNTIIGDLKFKNYFEPFLGGGAVFFQLQIENASFLSDLNAELINTYIALKDDPSKVITFLSRYENTSECYYKIRASHPTDPFEVAARFIFLNQTSFNGIYRVNMKGEYNVPYGKRVKPFLDKNALLSASQKLQLASLRTGDFECIKDQIGIGDLVFLDPPYTVSHNNNGFIKYNQKLFALEDQYRLRKLIDFIKEKGAYYILTNAAHKTVYEIFYQASDLCYELSRASLIGGINANRGAIHEYVFTNIKMREA